jgi:hypothetical protein
LPEIHPSVRLALKLDHAARQGSNRAGLQSRTTLWRQLFMIKPALRRERGPVLIACGCPGGVLDRWLSFTGNSTTDDHASGRIVSHIQVPADHARAVAHDA